MNQLTTIAALPSGAGCLSALPAEVGEPPKPAQPPFLVPIVAALGLAMGSTSDFGDWSDDDMVVW